MSRVPTYPAATNVLRLIRILLESYYGLVSFKEICSKLSISDKTLRRYCEVLDYVFGDVIEVKTGEELGRSPARERFLVFERYGLESRTGYQLAPLYLSRFFMSFLQGTLLDESLADAVSLFESHVDKPDSLRKVGEFSQKFFAISFAAKSYAEHDETIECLLQALVRQNPVKMTYRKPGGEDKAYSFEPLTLTIYKQGLYIIGQNKSWDSPRFFAVERITSCERIKEQRFDYPERYSPQTLVEGSFGIFVDRKFEVCLRFGPEIPCDYIKSRNWHSSQQVIELSSGYTELRMTVSGQQELISWILSFGGNVEVKAPEELKNAVINHLHALNGIYDLR